jgi:hypothetical protein
VIDEVRKHDPAPLPAVADEGDDGDAVWDGLLWAARPPNRALFDHLKPGCSPVRPPRCNDARIRGYPNCVDAASISSKNSTVSLLDVCFA